MRFEWDSGKANTNLQKHGVTFDLAATVFNDPMHLSVVDRKNRIEERWITVGRAADQKTLLVVHLYVTNGDEVIRIISARRATKREKQQYEEGI